MSETLSTDHNYLRRIVAEAFAFPLDHEVDFEKERLRPDYPEALKNYADALWHWVEMITPKSTLDALAAAKFDLPDTPERLRNIEIAKLQYLLQRAVYVDGLKHGEGWNPKHAHYLAGFNNKTRLLRDDQLFEMATHRRYRRRKAEPTNRTLKHQLLIAWLSAGLWRMESRKQQWAALAKRGWQNAGFAENSLNMAQARLGLKWFKAPNKSTRRL